MTVDLFAFLAIDSGFHPIGEGGLRLSLFDDEGDLPSIAFAMIGCTGVFHAVAFLWAVSTVAEFAFKEKFGISISVFIFSA